MKANEYVVEMEIPVVGPRDIVCPAIRFSATPVSPKSSVPELGEHGFEILESLGLTDDEIVELNVQLDQGYHRLAQKYSVGNNASRDANR